MKIIISVSPIYMRSAGPAAGSTGKCYGCQGSEGAHRDRGMKSGTILYQDTIHQPQLNFDPL